MVVVGSDLCRRVVFNKNRGARIENVIGASKTMMVVAEYAEMFFLP